MEKKELPPPPRKHKSEEKTAAVVNRHDDDKPTNEILKVEEYELIQNIKDLFDRGGTGLVDSNDLQLLLCSVGNKLSKLEVGILKRFENKDGKVLYEDFVRTILYE